MISSYNLRKQFCRKRFSESAKKDVSELLLVDFDKRAVKMLLKELGVERNELKSLIKQEEKINEFSSKVDRLYDRLEGLDSLIGCLVDFAIILESTDNYDDKDEIEEFVSAVDWARKNRSGYSVEEVLDRVVFLNI